MNLTREVQALVAAFTVEIAGLAKQEALRQVTLTFGAPTPKMPAPALSPMDGKRSSTQLAEIKKRVLEHLSAHPGLRTEELNAALGASTPELALPLRQLVADGLLRTKGTRRGMRYYADGKSKRARRTTKRRPQRSALRTPGTTPSP